MKGDTPLTITWRKDGHAIDPTHRIQVNSVDQYNSLLVIDNLQADHTGNYSCVVRNSAAEVEGTQGLLVNGNVVYKIITEENLNENQTFLCSCRHCHWCWFSLTNIKTWIYFSFLLYNLFYFLFFFFCLTFQYLPLLSLFPFKTA